jgi:hypothetical protein
MAPAQRFPSVLLQPLGHLSVLESTICERSGTVYRKTLLQILVFRDTFGIQWLANARNAIAVEIVSELLMSSHHLRTFSISRTVDDHNGTSNRGPKAANQDRARHCLESPPGAPITGPDTEDRGRWADNP